MPKQATDTGTKNSVSVKSSSDLRGAYLQLYAARQAAVIATWSDDELRQRLAELIDRTAPELSSNATEVVVARQALA